jgi:hypothetical protein
MNSHMARVSRLETQAGVAGQPKLPVVVFMDECADADALGANAQRERGLHPDEAHVLVVQWIASKK